MSLQRSPERAAKLATWLDDQLAHQSVRRSLPRPLSSSAILNRVGKIWVCGELPPALKTALKRRRLLVFAGAGVSKLPPSCLPDWVEFNEILLETIKATALNLRSLSPEGRAAINGLALVSGEPQPNQISFKVLSDATYSIFAGFEYPSMLRVLDSTRANANHRAIAELVARGTVRAIVTTNFDTLIERACTESGVSLRVVLPSGEINDGDQTACSLYKIHGSVTQASSLIDTVGHKIRGLPPATYANLTRLFHEYHVVVIGYSGEDLEFAPDYLPFSAVDTGGPGLSWFVRPGSAPRTLVKAAVLAAGERGAIVEGSLPELFVQLGAKVDARASTDEQVHAAAVDAVKARVKVFVRTARHSSAGAFCVRVLNDTGNRSGAAEVRKALTAEVEAEADYVVGRSGPALRVLADTTELESPSRAEYWRLKELHAIERLLKDWRNRSLDVRARLRTAGPRPQMLDTGFYPFDEPLTPASWLAIDRVVVEDLQRAQSGAWTNLAFHYMTTGRQREAGDALDQSLSLAELCADSVALSAMYQYYGAWRIRTSADPDQPLNWLALAEATGIGAGYLGAANNAALARAQTLILLGEYDSALAMLVRVQARVELGFSRAQKVEVDRIHAMIEVRRGKIEEGLATFERAIATAASDDVAATRVRWTMIEDLSFLEHYRSRLIDCCDAVLQTMSDGIVPTDGRVPGIKSLAEVQQARNRLLERRVCETPPFLLVVRRASGSEWARRHHLIEGEFAGDNNKIWQCLSDLADLKFRAHRFVRMYELATASNEAAKRSRVREWQVLSQCAVGAALFWSGDLQAAKAVFQPLADDEVIAVHGVGDELRHRLHLIAEGQIPEAIPKGSVHILRFLTGRMPHPNGVKQLEDWASEVSDAGDYPIARAILFQAMAAYRDRCDDAAMARCYDLMAAMAEREHGNKRALALREKASRLRSSELI